MFSRNRELYREVAVNVAIAIRGGELVIYLWAEGVKQGSLLSKLGKHRKGNCCLYLKMLADLD